MRLIALIFLLTHIGALSARADTLVVTGVLLENNGVRAGGYTVKIYVTQPNIGVTSDDTSSNGIYTIVKENVEASTVNSWYVICEQGSQKAFAKLVFNRKPNNIWQAKVEDLTLRSSNQASYSPNGAAETIRTITTIESIKVKSGEQTLEAANEQAEAEVARVLGHTDLGQSPETALQQINQAVVQTSDTNLPKLTLMSGDKFVALRNRPEFMKFTPDAAVWGIMPERRRFYDRRGFTGKWFDFDFEQLDIAASIRFVKDYLTRVSHKRPFGFTVVLNTAPDLSLVTLVVTDNLKTEDILDWLIKSPTARTWAFYNARLQKENLTDSEKTEIIKILEQFRTHNFDLSMLPKRP